MRYHRLPALTLALAMFPAVCFAGLPWSGFDVYGVPCEIKHPANAFGPEDYNNPVLYLDDKGNVARSDLDVVESIHFTPDVENLIAGNTGDEPLPDLQYTLRAFPNHYRALYSIVRLQLQSRERLPIPPECWLERGLVYRPNDPNIYLVYGIYLHRLGMYKKALEKYQRAESLSEHHNSEIYYNMGLLYLDMNDLEHATAYANKAYGLGYPLTGLRNRLSQRGVSLNR